MDLDIKQIVDGLEEDEFYLPVGYTDAEGIIHRKGRLKLMDGYAEEAMADAKVRDNGGKLVTALLQNVIVELDGVPKVTREVIRNLTTIDRDYLTLKNCIYSLDEVIKFIAPCNHCGGKNEVTVDLKSIEIKYLKDEDKREMTFDLARGYRDRDGVLHKSITIALPTGAVQERMANILRVNPAQAETTMLQLITSKLGTMEFINPDVFKSLAKKDRDLITKKLGEVDAGASFVVKGICNNCGEEFECVIPFQAILGE